MLKFQDFIFILYLFLYLSLGLKSWGGIKELIWIRLNQF